MLSLVRILTLQRPGNRTFAADASCDWQWHRNCAMHCRVGKPFVDGLLFTLLPTPRSRWKSFATGWSVQALSLVGLLFVSARFHQDLVPPEDYRVINLVSHEPLALREQQPVIPPVLARSKPPLESQPSPQSKPAVAALVVTPQIRAIREHKLPEPDRPAPELKLDSKMPVIPAAPTPKIVAVGTFSAGGPVTATPSKPA